MAMFSKNMGPCVLDYGGTELGETFGGTNFVYNFTTAKSMADSSGEIARSKIITGISCFARTALTEPTLTQLNAVIQGATLTGTIKLALRSPIGTDLVANTAILILKPIIDGIAGVDEEDWTYIPKASVTPNFDTPFQLDNQKVWAVEFEGHKVLAVDIASGGCLDGETYIAGDIAILGYSA